MAWRAAYSLQTLKSQLDSAYPGWLFLGYLGDAAHAGVPSDHNPNPQGVVCAMDIGPGGGLDIHKLADNIVAKPHPDLKYIISNRRIAEWQNGFQWRPYSGSDPHDTHIHISVGRGPDGQSVQPYDDRVQWNITKGEPMASDAFINLQYILALGRPAKEEDLKAWRGQPSEQVAFAVAGSGERDSFIKWRVQKFFRGFLQRDAKPNEVALYAPLPEKDQLNGISDSPEAKAVTTQYNNGAGGAPKVTVNGNEYVPKG